MVKPVAAVGVPQVKAARAGKYLWSLAEWSAEVSSAITQASALLVTKMLACPVTATLASLPPSGVPKSIVAVPVPELTAVPQS